jgi:hypothetical protein
MPVAVSRIRVNISGNDIELPTASFSLVTHRRIVCNNGAGFGKNFTS